MVLQLESGSATAETRLVNAFHADDDDHRNEILNSLAISAANGSPYALELLLGFMTDYRLAAPAIGRHVQSPAVIEEVEQEVLIAVARSIHRFRAEAKFTTWLYSLARNTAVSELRRLKQTSSIDDETGPNAGSVRWSPSGTWSEKPSTRSHRSFVTPCCSETWSA
jgi:hypothetical protein